MAMSGEPSRDVKSSRVPGRRRAAKIIMIGTHVVVAINIVQGLVLVPLYIHYVGGRLYGAWLGAGGVVAWLALFDMGLASVMIQRTASAQGQGDLGLARRYFLSGLVLQLAMVSVLMAAAAGLAAFVPGWMGVDGADRLLISGCFFLGALAAGLNILSYGFGGLGKALQRPMVPTVANVVAGLAGMATTLTVLLQGYGLWAIPIGLLARSGLVLIISAVYAWHLLRKELNVRGGVDGKLLREIAAMSPALFSSSVGNAAVGQGEAAIIAIVAGPELATVFVLTRRAADIIGMVLDSLAGAVFSGFSHLYGEGSRARARQVLDYLLAVYSAGAAVLLGTYLALNRGFVHQWVGGEFFGGSLLTALFALALLLSRRNSMVLYLYGATGEIARSAYLNVMETSLRLVLMILLLMWLGLVGLPLAVLATGVVFHRVIARRMTARVADSDGDVPALHRYLSQPVHWLVLAGGLIMGLSVDLNGWIPIVLAGMSFFICAVAFVLATDRPLREDVLRLLKGWRTQVVS